MEASEPEQLKDALKQLIESVTLNSDSLSADFAWKIPNVTGVKLVSPRGVEPLLPG